MIISYLRDLVRHLGNLQIKVIKLTGDAQGNVKIQAVESDNKSVVVNGKFNKKVTEFDGVIGLSDLKMLESFVSIYSDPNDIVEIVREDREIEVDGLDEDGNPAKVKETENVISGFVFKRQKPSMKNPYRVMDKRLIPQQFDPKQIVWDVTFKPSKTGIKLFMIQAGLGLSENFSFEQRGTDLFLTFGDAEIHFADNIPPKLTTKRFWGVSVVQALLKLSETADCEMSFNNDKGAIKIKLDTGLAIYEYILPAKSGPVS